MPDSKGVAGLVSVLVCTRNRAENLRETLASIRACRVPEGMQAELVVVDNGSTDHTQEVLSAAAAGMPSLRHFREDRVGASSARNRALRESRGAYLLCTDDDVRVPADWMERMCAPLAAGEADAVQGGIRMAEHLVRPWMDAATRLALFEILEITPEQEANPFLIGANMGFRRAVLEKVNGFDEELGPGALGYGEEALFAEQLKAAGFVIRFVRDAAVEHNFDARRLLRESFLEAARKQGRCAAYLSYHWAHEKVAYPRLRLALNTARLWAVRLGHWRDCRRVEGVYAPEAMYLFRCERYREHLRLLGTPRKYEKRGLRKLGALEASDAGGAA